LRRACSRPGDGADNQALADESGINMMTVNKAYQLLKPEGYYHRRPGSGALSRGGKAAQIKLKCQIINQRA
jgi:DNA-binding transcriptional regulator YhcF (GntR family)